LVDLEELIEVTGDVCCEGCGGVLVVLGERDPLRPPEPATESSGTTDDLPDPADLLMNAPDSSPPPDHPAPGPAAASEAGAAEDEVTCPACGHRFVESAPESRPSVLIVEDTDFFMEIATDALCKRYRTIGVKTAADALDVLRREPIDLLVLDLALPDGAGVEVLRASPDPDLPVLVYTTASEDVMFGEAWHELRSLGADDILFKGVNAGEELIEKAEKLLAPQR
jgi:CheY-like chemotaxis protein